MKRVLVVSYEYPPLGGGGGVIFRDLARELARRIEVTVLTSGRRGLATHEREDALEIVRTPVWLRNAEATASLPSMLSFFPSSLRSGARLLRSRPYDLVHTSFAVPSGPSALLLARRFGLPHVLSIHGGDVWDPSKRLSPHRTPLLKQAVRQVLQRSDRVVAQSRDTARRAREIYGEREIDVVPLAVERPRFEPRPRSALGLDPDAPVLVTVGRLIARKGLPELLDVVAGLPAPRPQLVVVGEGPLRGALEARVREAGITDRVLFTGFVPEERKWQLLEAADLYVSTTHHEGFGIVFLEALACGLPVVTYDRGGQTDFLDDAVARLVPAGDAEGVRAAVAELLAAPGRVREMGERARAVAADFTIERMAERYLALYAACLERGPAREGR